MIDAVIDWFVREEDSMLQLPKLCVVVVVCFFSLITSPIWIVPYLVYKQLKK